jgi:hypothetical protein
LTDTEGACLAFRPSIGPLSQRTPHFAIGRYGELKSVENSGRPTGLFIAAGSVFRGAKESLAQPTSIQTGLRPADSDPLVFVALPGFVWVGHSARMAGGVVSRSAEAIQGRLCTPRCGFALDGLL